MSKVAALRESLLHLKKGTLAAVDKELVRLGISERKDGVTEVFDCFEKNTSNHSITISLHGVVFKIFIYALGDEISIVNCPDATSLVLVVQDRENAVIESGSFVHPELMSRLTAAPRWESHPSGALYTQKICVKITSPFAPGAVAFDKLFAKCGTGPSEHSSPMWLDGNCQIKAAIDPKVLRGTGAIFPDKMITEDLLTVHCKHAAQSSSGAHVIAGDFIGEIAYRLSMKMRQNTVHAFEYHPCAAQVLNGAKVTSALDNLTIEATCDWKSRTNKTTPSHIFPNFIGIFPFVKKDAYAAGYPEFNGEGMFKGPSMPRPELPSSIVDPNKELEASMRVGAALMKVAILNMLPGSIGTFLVPTNFGTSQSEFTIRQIIVSFCTVLDYRTCSKDNNIISVQRRDGQVFPFPKGQSERDPNSSAPNIRWVEQEPVFVTDSSIAGMNAGTPGHFTLRNAVTHLAAPTTVAMFAKLQTHGSVRLMRGANDRPIYETNLWADPTCSQIQIATNPTFIISSKHDSGDLHVTRYSGPPQVGMGVANYALTTSFADRLELVLNDSKTREWLVHVTSSDAVSAAVLGSIPLP